MKVTKLTIIILLFLTNYLSYSQNVGEYIYKPDAVAYKCGRIVSADGIKLSPEATRMLFEDDESYEQYKRTCTWHMVSGVVGVSAGLIAGVVIPAIVDIGRNKKGDAFREDTLTGIYIGCFSVFMACVLPEALLKRKMIRWVDVYNSQGIIQTHAELSVGPTPSGFGLCVNF